MGERKDTRMAVRRAGDEPFRLLRDMTSELERMFDEPFWGAFRRPTWLAGTRPTTWSPEIDIFEKDNRLVTTIDLPGMKKEDIKVEVTDGHLAISGERRSEAEEKKEHYYRCEREFGSFYRAVPLPEGVTLQDVKATFANGVLEVSVPLPARTAAKPRTVAITEGPPAKAA